MEEEIRKAAIMSYVMGEPTKREIARTIRHILDGGAAVALKW